MRGRRKRTNKWPCFVYCPLLSPISIPFSAIQTFTTTTKRRINWSFGLANPPSPKFPNPSIFVSDLGKSYKPTTMIRNGGRLNFKGIDKAAHGFGFGFGSGSGTSSPSVAVTTPGPLRRLKCSAAGFNQYAVLGLSPFASKSDVKHAYKRLALKYHPDVVRGDTGSEKNEMFREIKSAYESIMRKMEEEEEMRSNNSFDEWDEWDEWMGCEGGIPTPTYHTF